MTYRRLRNVGYPYLWLVAPYQRAPVEAPPVVGFYGDLSGDQ